ncbi:MAG: hypothetical protein IJU52_09145 [Clostridia bacterium]|nr:hypothetical protein [Clostridia bacterium]
MLGFLGCVTREGMIAAVGAFPRLLVTALFCILQTVVYVPVFMPKARQRVVGFAIPV